MTDKVIAAITVVLVIMSYSYYWVLFNDNEE